MSRARELSKLVNNAVFSVDSSYNVGVNSITPTVKLDVVGIVSATSFSGDGSGLSGITAGATLSAGSGAQRVVVTSLTSGTMTSAATDAELTYNSTSNTLSASTFSGALSGNATSATNAQGLTGSPDITVGSVTASGNVSIAGTLTYEDVTNIDSIGVVTARSGVRVGGGQSIGSDGVLTYYGDGSQLSGISAGISTGAASGGLVTLNLTNQDHKVTASGITTITVSGGTEGDSHTVRVVNSGVSTVGFSTYFLFPSGSTPSMPTASGTISILSFTVHRVGTAGTQLLAGAALNFS